MAGFAEYEQHDATGLAALVRKGEVTPEELIEEAITRAEALNPELNVIVLKMYDQARQAIRDGLPEGAYRGVPWLLKDLGTNYAGTPTTSACALFTETMPTHDSELVSRYKQAGLCTFGKTATPEFGLTTSTESLLWGATRNPWNGEYSSGGSSGGTSSAIAAGIVPASDGSDGGGSIRIPAACCGLVGLKVSRGRIAPGPDKGESWSGMSTSGVLSRSVRDTAGILDCVVGYAPGDPYCAPALDQPLAKSAGAPPAKLRIALHTQAYNGVETHAECKEAAERAAKLCEELGHRVEERVLEYDQKRYARAFRAIVGGHTKRVVDDRLAELGRELQDGDLEPITRATYENSSRYSAADYVFAINTIHDVTRRTADFLQDFDVILTPTMPMPTQKLGGALRLHHPDAKAFGAALSNTVGFTQFYNASGNPAISLPLHWGTDGLPIGVQFAGRYGEEGTLLALAAQLEEAQPWADRRPDLKTSAAT